MRLPLPLNEQIPLQFSDQMNCVMRYVEAWHRKFIHHAGQPSISSARPRYARSTMHQSISKRRANLLYRIPNLGLCICGGCGLAEAQGLAKALVDGRGAGCGLCERLSPPIALGDGLRLQEASSSDFSYLQASPKSSAFADLVVFD